MTILYKKFQQIVFENLSDLSDKIIFKSKIGYVLYNQYVIYKNQDKIMAYRRRDEYTHTFNSIKNAFTWAILDHHTKISELNRVSEIDMLMQSVSIDINIHNKLSKSGSADQRLTNAIKLQTDKQRQRRFRYELDKYYTMADNYHKRKGISNERR